MNVNVFVDAISETRRRLASELRTAAATASGRALRGILLSSADQLDRPRAMDGVVRQIFVVKGEEISDGAGTSWLVGAFGSAKAADGLVGDLTATAVAFGRSIGNEELVGLELTHRRELESHLQRIDREAKVGRHGVRWYAVPTTLKIE